MSASQSERPQPTLPAALLNKSPTRPAPPKKRTATTPTNDSPALSVNGSSGKPKTPTPTPLNGQPKGKKLTLFDYKEPSAPKVACSVRVPKYREVVLVRRNGEKVAALYRSWSDSFGSATVELEGRPVMAPKIYEPENPDQWIDVRSALEEVRAKRFQPIDIHDLLAADLPRPPELVHGILHQGSKMIIGGGSKSFKTWTLLDLALSVAAGVPWWGFPTTKGKALYVNFEIQDAFFRDRVEAILAARDAKVERGQLTYLGMRGQPWKTEYLRQAVEQMGLSLIVIDPIYKGLGDRDENSAGNMAKLMGELEEIAVESGAAVLFGHHFSKGNQSAKEAIDRVSGSGVFARDPDSILTMTRHKEEDSFTVDCILRNFPPVDSFCVRRAHPLMVRDDSLNPTDLKQAGGHEEKYQDDEILAPLRDAGSLTHGEWKSAVLATSPMSGSTFNIRLRKLISTGTVTKDGSQYIESKLGRTRVNAGGGKTTSFVQP